MLRRIAILLFVAFATLAHTTAEERGADGLVPDDELGALSFDGGSYALVIGINAYANGWPRLSNAAKDASAIAEELGKRGFDVTLATDLNSGALEAAIEDFIFEKGRETEARLLIWYAGHGHTIDGEAYLVPADAPAADTDWEFRRSALSMRDFGKYMREARSRHVLAIFDSCFSGGVFETVRSSQPAAITRATGLPVRQMISSGEASQSVSDDGTFRRLFIDALRGDEPLADANRDGFLTGSELGLFLSDKVTTLTNNRQTPRYGKLRELGLDRGDFVFRLDGNAATGGGGQELAALPRPSDPVPAPRPPAPAQPTREELPLEGGQTTIMLDGRLIISMIGTPIGGRGDLAGLMVNGERANMAVGSFVDVDAGGGQACIITLFQIHKGENRGTFMIQCGTREAVKRDAPPAQSVALGGLPNVFEEFTMARGESRILEPGGVILSFLSTPTGGRRDLVAYTVNGKRWNMAVGQDQQEVAGGANCTLTTTKIHYGENRADFVWRCE